MKSKSRINNARSRVSVCIPTYNGARYLEACIDSVLNQTYENIEILAVDDGSTDDTFEMLERYAISNTRIRLLRNERNLGLVGNWNRCVELAQGEWIKFVFQDDTIAPECLERMIDAAQPNSSLVFCHRNFIFEEGTSDSKRKSYLEGKSLIEHLFPDSRAVTARQFTEFALTHMGRNFIGEPSAVLLNKRVFQEYGRFNPHLIVSCDTEYWIRVGVHAGVTPVPEILASFRVHSDSVSARSQLQRDYRVDVLDELATLHEFIYNPIYAPLRNLAVELSIDLTQIFKTKSMWAYGRAQRAAKDTNKPDGSLLEEWKEVSDNFRGLGWMPLRFYLLYYWRLFTCRCRTLLGLEKIGN